ncbi:TPA: flippase [Bacillus cereus]|nr:flippase [Bacillus cereus]
MLKHLFYYLTAQGVPAFISFVSISIFSRYVSPNEYGKFATFIVTIGIFNTVLFEWIRMGILKYYPIYKNTESNSEKFLATIVYIYKIEVLVCFTFSMLLILYNYFSLFELDIYVYAISGGILLCMQSIFLVVLTLFRANLKPLSFSCLTVTKTVVILLVSLLLLKYNPSYISLILGTVLGFFVSLIVCLIILPKSYIKKIFRVKPDKEALFSMLKYGLPFTITFAMSYITNSIDRIMLYNMMGEKSVGLYSIPYDLGSQSVTIFMTVVNLAMYPIIMKERANTKGDLNKYLKMNINLLLVIGVPATIGISVLSPNISTVLLGDNYQISAIQILPLVSVSAFINCLTVYYLNLPFQLSNKTTQQIYPTLLGAVTNIGLNMLLIPKLGIVGAVYASLIAYIICFCLGWIWSRKINKLPFDFSMFFKIILSTCIMTIDLFLLKDKQGVYALLIQVLTGAMVYFLSLFILNLVSLKESGYGLKSIKDKWRIS